MNQTRYRHGAYLFAALLLLAGTASHAADLADVLLLAEENDPEYSAAEAAMQATSEARPQAIAQLLPSLSASASRSRNREDTQRAVFSNKGIVDTDAYSLTLVQPLFHADDFIQLQQAKKEALQAEATFAAAGQALMQRTARAYFAVLSARDTLDFARSEKQAIKRQLEQAQQRFEVGLIAITGVQESKAARDLAVADEIAAENALDVANEGLRELTGSYIDALAPLGAEVPLLSPEPDDIDAWTKTALENNPELLALRLQTDIARNEVQRQRAGHLPTVDFVGEHSVRDVAGGSFGDSESTDNTLSVQLSLPIFEGGAVLSRTREAGFLHQKQFDDLERRQRAVQRGVREAYLGVQSGISRVKALQQALVSARTALEATEAGYEVGTRTTVDVLDAQSTLFRAKRDFAQARYDYLLSTLDLRAAAGSLSRIHIEDVSGWLASPPGGDDS